MTGTREYWIKKPATSRQRALLEWEHTLNGNGVTPELAESDNVPPKKSGSQATLYLSFACFADIQLERVWLPSRSKVPYASG